MRNEPIVVEQIVVGNSKSGTVQGLGSMNACVMDFNMTGELGMHDGNADKNAHEGPPTPSSIEKNPSSEDEESRDEEVQIVTCKEEKNGSQPSSPPSQISSQISETPSSSPGEEFHLSQTNFYNQYRVKTLDKNGQLIVNQNISKYPIDFIFSGIDEKGHLQVEELENMGEKAKKYNKKTPLIYFAKNEVFDRNDYENKRKTMLTRTKYMKKSKADFRVQLTRYPKCFLLIELSASRTEWFRNNFPHHPKILEFVQIKPLPSDEESYESIEEESFVHGTEEQWRQWFEIDESADFYPETGMF